MAAIFSASAQSDVGMARGVPDTLTHGMAYLVLGLLVSRALSGGLGRPLSLGHAALVVLVSTLYGVSDEWHQSLVPGRDASVWDVVKDFGGAAVAVVAWRVFVSAAQRARPEKG